MYISISGILDYEGPNTLHLIIQQTLNFSLRSEFLICSPVLTAIVQDFLSLLWDIPNSFFL